MVDMVRDLVFGNIVQSTRLGISVVLGIDRLAQDVLADKFVKAARMRAFLSLTRQ